MKITITNRYTGAEIFSLKGDDNTVVTTLLAAINGGADLRGADLYGADLGGADLGGADLRGADLYGADLGGAKIDGEEVKIAPLCINGLHWWVLITDSFMRIGCQRHSHAEWLEFSDAEMDGMDSSALELWRVWKAPLIAMCAQHALNAAAAKVEAVAP